MGGLFTCRKKFPREKFLVVGKPGGRGRTQKVISDVETLRRWQMTAYTTLWRPSAKNYKGIIASERVELRKKSRTALVDVNARYSSCNFVLFFFFSHFVLFDWAVRRIGHIALFHATLFLATVVDLIKTTLREKHARDVIFSRSFIAPSNINDINQNSALNWTSARKKNWLMVEPIKNWKYSTLKNKSYRKHHFKLVYSFLGEIRFSRLVCGLFGFVGGAKLCLVFGH